MKITVHRIETMTLEEFCDRHGLSVEVRESPSGNWFAQIPQFVDAIPIYGATPSEAVAYLTAHISGYIYRVRRRLFGLPCIRKKVRVPRLSFDALKPIDTESATQAACSPHDFVQVGLATTRDYKCHPLLRCRKCGEKKVEYESGCCGNVEASKPIEAATVEK